MAIGLAAAVLNGWLNALCRAANYTAPTAFWVKLHLADPGAAGATSPAANATRVQATFGTTASGGSIANTADINWTSVPNAETYSHVSFWDASTAGTFLGSDDLATPRLVAVGDNFTIATGSLVIAITPVAA